MLTRLEELWNYAQSISNEDDPNPEPTEFKEISKEVIRKTVAKIDAKLSGNEKASSKAKPKLRYIKNNFTANLEKHEKQEAILGERNSYGKTDTEATFMRMKEDYMLNGQLNRLIILRDQPKIKSLFTILSIKIPLTIKHSNLT